MLDALTGKIGVTVPPVTTPSGTSRPPSGSGPGSLRLQVDTPVVNAAEAPAVSFSTVVTGSVADLRHDLVDAAGRTLVSNLGGDFQFEAAEPGTYTATVTGLDANQRTLSASAMLYADYLATVPADCPALTGTDINECATAPVPVRAGIQSLTVTATRTPRAAEPGSGTLVLLDPAGTEVLSAPMASNVATLTLTAPSPPGDWSMVYRPAYGLLEDVEYTIDLHHSQP